MLNAFNDAGKELDAQISNLIKRRESLLGPAYRLFYTNPVHFVKGSGVWLFDPAGNAYLDAYNNVAALGHCHPRVVRALSEQAARLNTHTRYLGADILNYAEELLATFDRSVNRVMFTCSGSEANDLALRLAYFHTEGSGVIVTEMAYHGVTAAIAACSPSLGPKVAPAGHVRTVPPPDSYFLQRDSSEAFAYAIQKAIESLRHAGIRPAALLVDSMFTSDGIYPEPTGAIERGCRLAQDEGLLLVVDEVQAGFGRTGSHMWGYQRRRLVPDIVTMGKPMGNGHPVAGLAARADLLDKFGASTRYFNTFGGNTVSCAVAHEVLRILHDEDILSNTEAVGSYFLEQLRRLATDFSCIGDVRGVGLFLGVELVRNGDPQQPDADLAAHVVNEMRNKRVLISLTGHRGNVLKIRPPLVFQRCHVDLFVEILNDVLENVRTRKLA